jgi:hypothetical protein
LLVYEGDQGVGLDPPRIPGPPASQLLAREADRVALVEVGAIARRNQRGDRRRVVERRIAKGEVPVQSGWPDSNRRLLRPKRSTLTRLSYTPKVPEV